MDILLIKHNLKKDTYKNVIIIIIIASILAIGNLNILSSSNRDCELELSQIFTSIFGGFSNSTSFEEQLILLLEWSFPHLLIFYLLNLYISNRLLDDMILILPRMKNKIRWAISLHASIILLSIKYYFYMFLTYISVSYIFIGKKAFFNIDYRVFLSIIILSILMCISINILLININILFNKNSVISIVVLLLLLISNFIKSSNKFIFKNIFINNAMIIRHSEFSNIGNFTILYSILYFSVFIILNLLINFFLISKFEINKLKIF